MTLVAINKKIATIKSNIKRNIKEYHKLEPYSDNKDIHYRLSRIRIGLEDLINDLASVEHEKKLLKGGRVSHPGHVQSVLFDKKYWTVPEATKEFHHLGFTLFPGKKVHVTGKEIRYRVEQPNYKKYSYKTIWFSQKDHIKAIYGYPKKSVQYYTGN